MPDGASHKRKRGGGGKGERKRGGERKGKKERDGGREGKGRVGRGGKEAIVMGREFDILFMKCGAFDRH